MSLFAELKRRNVIRVAIGYLAEHWWRKVKPRPP